MSRRSLRFGTSSTLILAAACQLAGSGGPTTSPVTLDGSRPPTGALRSSRVGSDELRALEDQSLEQALLRTRPAFLRPNPSGWARPGNADRPGVYIDNVYVGSLDALQLVPVVAVHEILYLRPSAAHDRFGSYCPCDAGVIVVMTHRSK